jgi:hypothetical protein|tara:strand:- start:108 stop:704 length:597 start_codon:yes stop_codon:yes gene_type:complete
MCKKVIIGALLGGVVLLLWQSAVHMVLGVYDDAFVKLKDPAAVEAVLKDNFEGSGMIVIPLPIPGDSDAEAKAMEKITTGFSMSGAVNRDGRHGFGAMLGVQFAVNVLASALLMFVLLAANTPTLGSRLALVLCFAVFAVLTELIPNWNWGGASLAYIGRQIGEQIVGWALVGLVLAKVMDKCGACCGSDGADATPDA